MQECYDWNTNTLDFTDVNGNKYYFELKGTKTIVGGETATGKTLVCNKLMDIIQDDNIGMKPYAANNIFVFTQQNREKLFEQNHKLILIDRAEMVLSEVEIEFINADTSSNRYIIFARAPLGIDLSPNYFAEIENDSGTTKIKYLFDERGWN